MIVEHKSKKMAGIHLLVEIILRRAVLRHRIKADKFHFDYLGERETKGLPENFALLVQELAQFAPYAAVNRVAYYLRDKADPFFAYPSKNAFFEEITWRLWQLGKTRPAQAGLPLVILAARPLRAPRECDNANAAQLRRCPDRC